MPLSVSVMAAMGPGAKAATATAPLPLPPRARDGDHGRRGITAAGGAQGDGRNHPIDNGSGGGSADAAAALNGDLGSSAGITGAAVEQLVGGDGLRR